jgi:hypothetical protein
MDFGQSLVGNLYTNLSFTSYTILYLSDLTSCFMLFLTSSMLKISFYILKLTKKTISRVELHFIRLELKTLTFHPHAFLDGFFTLGFSLYLFSTFAFA